VSNYWVFGANQSINSYFAAISRHQGWFPYFSAGPVGRHAGKKGYSANPSIQEKLDSTVLFLYVKKAIPYHLLKGKEFVIREIKNGRLNTNQYSF